MVRRLTHPVLIALLLAAVTTAVYWPVLRHEFINYDDPYYVTENPRVQAGLTQAGLVWAFTQLHGEHTYWHPVTWLSHMLDCQLFGLNAGAHHLVNVLLHAANVSAALWGAAAADGRDLAERGGGGAVCAASAPGGHRGVGRGTEERAEHAVLPADGVGVCPLRGSPKSKV